MSEDVELKARVLADVRAHLRIYGPKKWDLVLSKYPEIPRRTFYRWVAQVRDMPTGPRVRIRKEYAGGEEVLRAQNAEAMADGANRARMAAIKNIPAAPSPDYMTRGGIRAEDQIDFLAMVVRLAKDGEKLRSYSVKPDPTQPDGEGIKNPTMFAASIDKRLKVIDTAVRIMQEVWDLQYMQRFFDAIVDIIVEEIGPAHPDIQGRILARLKELNDKRGMTQYAGMS
jgi:hypothetical protein